MQVAGDGRASLRYQAATRGTDIAHYRQAADVVTETQSEMQYGTHRELRRRDRLHGSGIAIIVEPRAPSQAADPARTRTPPVHGIAIPSAHHTNRVYIRL